MKSTKKASTTKRVFTAVLIAILTGSTSPWWWPELKSLIHKQSAAQRHLSSEERATRGRLIERGHTVMRGEIGDCQRLLTDASEFLEKIGDPMWERAELKAHQKDKDVLADAVNEITLHLEHIKI